MSNNVFLWRDYKHEQYKPTANNMIYVQKKVKRKRLLKINLN